MILKNRWIMAVRLALREAPIEEIRAVMQVPMFWPMISGMAIWKVTTPVVLMACRMPMEAEEDWSRAVISAPTATPRKGLEKAVNTA